MAAQIDTEELKGCKSYFGWLYEQVSPVIAGQDISNHREKLKNLCRVLFETDYIYEVAEDGIRASDAVNLRKTYAEKEGISAGKNERDTDRIWKSIHGKCSLMELIFSMCVRMDEMVNEGEEGAMIPLFFLILIENIGLFPNDGEKAWEEKIGVMMNRKYEQDGSGGGMFPLKNWTEETGKDQRKVPLWYQMCAWLNENLDEDEQFMVEKFLKSRSEEHKNG